MQMQKIVALIAVIVMIVVCFVGSLDGSKSISNKEFNIDRMAKEITALGAEVKVLKEKIYFFAMEKNDEKFDEALEKVINLYPKEKVKRREFVNDFMGFGSGYVVTTE